MLTQDLAPARRVLDRVLVAALWLHVPLVGAIAWQLDGPVLVLAGTAAALAALVTLLWATMAGAPTTRPAIGVATVGMVSLVLAATRGSLWQVDVHMYYFAVLAILAAYCDWVVILTAAGAIAVHHLALNFLAPALVFPGGADLARVLLHAVIVVFETAALVWMSRQVDHLFAAMNVALATAERATVEAAAMRDAQSAARQRATADKVATLTHMAEQIEHGAGETVQKIGTRTDQMIAIAEEMGTLASRSGESARGAADAADLALGNAQTVASAAVQLAASIGRINEAIGRSAVVVNQAVESGRETHAAIEALNERVKHIGAVANIISGIASQTNLLALNATIEAARAGEAGRGFAVVANEVKQLATQTGRSTEEIAGHIREVSAATALAVVAVNRIGATINEINDISGAIATAVEQQGAATSEIARNVNDTTTAVHEMSSKNVAVSRDAEQAGRYAREVLAGSRSLNEFIAELKGTIVRIARTSTADLNRRQHPRLGAALHCQVQLHGHAGHGARIIDISDGGAQLEDMRNAPAGARGTLRIDGLDATLPFTVMQSDGSSTHLHFVADEATMRSLHDFVERLSLPAGE